MDNAQCKAIIDKHMKEYGKLDVLVNNASKQIMSSSLEEIKVSLSSFSWSSSLEDAARRRREHLQE